MPISSDKNGKYKLLASLIALNSLNDRMLNVLLPLQLISEEKSNLVADESFLIFKNNSIFAPSELPTCDCEFEEVKIGISDGIYSTVLNGLSGGDIVVKFKNY